MKLSLLARAVALAALVSSAAAQVQAFSGDETRQLSRIFYYSRSDTGFQTHGQVAIDYGQAQWKAEYENEEFKENMKGQRWRFGTGPWTRFDTQVDVTFGETKIVAGSYFIVLEYTKEGEMNLVFLDAAAIQKKKWDAFMVGQTTGGIAVALDWSDDEEEKAEKLKISISADSKDPKNCSFEVRFGPHKLSTSFVASVE